MTDQHTRWAARAERREAWADAAEAKAATLVANHSTDWAFVSQPGHIPARARQIAQTDRAMDLLNQAAAHRAKATNLEELKAALRKRSPTKEDRTAIDQRLAGMSDMERELIELRAWRKANEKPAATAKADEKKAPAKAEGKKK